MKDKLRNGLQAIEAERVCSRSKECVGKKLCMSNERNVQPGI